MSLTSMPHMLHMPLHYQQPVYLPASATNSNLLPQLPLHYREPVYPLATIRNPPQADKPPPAAGSTGDSVTKSVATSPNTEVVQIDTYA